MNLRDMQTRSNRVPEIDSLYVYQTNQEVKDLVKRQQPGENYKYMNHKAIEYAGESEIYTYHQTVKIDGSTQGICLVTKEHRITKIKQFIKKSVADIKANEEKLAAFKSARRTPKQLGYFYLAE